MRAVRAPDEAPKIALAYSGLLFFGAHLWLFFHDWGGQTPQAYASFVCQQLALVLAYALIDSRLRNMTLRFALAGTAALYVAFIQLDALLIHVVGLSSLRVLNTFIAGGWTSLAEIGLKPLRLALLVLAILSACLGGGIVHRLLERRTRAIRLQNGWVTAVLLLSVLFIVEQIHSRESRRYLYRSLELPGYLQIYDTASRSYQVKLDNPTETVARHAHLSQIAPAQNPRHVLFLLLESLRADAIDPEISPTLHELSQASLHFENAYAEATFTPLAWNVLLLDRPAHMFIWPRSMLAPQAPGSWPLNVLRRAGYRIWISSSTDLDYGHFLPFLLGDDHLVDRLHVVGGRDLPRWKRDDRATERLTHWIESMPTDAPTFMLLQLDSTHWTYDFPPNGAVVKPYSAPLSMPVPVTTTEEFRLLHNRYLNCVHHVDAKIAEVREALRRRSLLEETAIVVIADHGEGFAPGIQGHAVLCEGTTRVPLMMSLPGIEPALVEQPVSSRNVFPTLFEYLEIGSFDQAWMLGRSVLPPRTAESEILMFSTDGRRADLRLADGTRIQFSVLVREESASFTPVRVLGPDGEPLADPGPLLTAVPWRRMLDRRLDWRQSEDSDRVATRK